MGLNGRHTDVHVEMLVGDAFPQAPLQSLGSKSDVSDGFQRYLYLKLPKKMFELDCDIDIDNLVDKLFFFVNPKRLSNSKWKTFFIVIMLLIAKSFHLFLLLTFFFFFQIVVLLSFSLL